jgi:CCR4-NOT transcription complex subunit 6
MADGFPSLDPSFEHHFLSSIYPKRSPNARNETSLDGAASFPQSLSGFASASSYFGIAQPTAASAAHQDMYAAQGGRGAPLNGASGRVGQQTPYSFQQLHPSHQHGGPTSHLGAVQLDHGVHNGVPGLGHPSTAPYTPYGGQVTQNGGPSHSATPSGAPAVFSEHWTKQLKAYEESKRAHLAMTENHQPHYFARVRASENKGIPVRPPEDASQTADGEGDEARRLALVEKPKDQQNWFTLDLSGHMLRSLAPTAFKYTFLQELYVASNKLARLPPAIGKLRALTLLDLSFNQLTELPPELGMCTYLKTLLVFNNNLMTLPAELGSLHLLEILGIEGNPGFSPELKSELAEKGTKSLITYLRENSPSMFGPSGTCLVPATARVYSLTCFVQFPTPRRPATCTRSKKTYPRTWSDSRCFRGTSSATSMRRSKPMATHPRKR